MGRDGQDCDQNSSRKEIAACRQGVLAQLRSRNVHERGNWSEVFAELKTLRNDLDAAKANQFALQREAVAASVSSPDADLSGLLADTPVAPHMCQQLSSALRMQLVPQGRPGIPLDPLLVSGCEAVISCLTAVGGPGGAEAGDKHNHNASSGSNRHESFECSRDGKEDLRIGNLEACFAGNVCMHLVAEQRGARAFDLTRMHRLVAKFRSLIADACYGSVLGDEDITCDGACASPGAGGAPGANTWSKTEETPRDDELGAEEEREEPLTPHEEQIYRKARREVTAKAMELHQRLYAAEILLAEKHQEVVLCYQRMADRSTEFKALHAQLSKLRQEHTAAIKDVQARKRYSTTIEEDNVLLKRQLCQQVDVVKGLESSLVATRQQLERAIAYGKGQENELKRSRRELNEVQDSRQIVAQTLARDVDCLLSVACRLQSEYLALQKVCSAYEGTIDRLHIGRNSPAVRREVKDVHSCAEDAGVRASPADLRVATHPLGSGFNDPLLIVGDGGEDGPGSSVPGREEEPEWGLGEVGVGGRGSAREEVVDAGRGTGEKGVAVAEVGCVAASGDDGSSHDAGGTASGSSARSEQHAGDGAGGEEVASGTRDDEGKTWGVHVQEGLDDIEASKGAEKERAGERAGSPATSEGGTPGSMREGGVTAEDFRSIRAAKNHRTAALAAKAAMSTSRGTLANNPFKKLVKDSFLGHVVSPTVFGKKDRQQEQREKRGGKRWDEAEISNLYEHWRQVRSGSSTPTSKSGQADGKEQSGDWGLEVGSDITGQVESRHAGEDNEVVLWRGDGGVLGVPDVLDAALDSEVACLSSQDIQDLLVDTALRVARTRRGFGAKGGGGDGAGAEDASTSVQGRGGGADKRDDRDAVYTASVRSLPSISPCSTPPHRSIGSHSAFANSRPGSEDAARAHSEGFNDPSPVPSTKYANGCNDGVPLSSLREKSRRERDSGESVDMKGSLGLDLQEDPKTGCFLVSRVVEDGAAQKAQIEVGDVLVEVNGCQVMPGSTVDNEYDPSYSLTELVQMCRGPVGSVANVKLLKGKGRWRLVSATITRV